MEAQHEPMIVRVKIDFAVKSGNDWLKSTSTLSGKRTRNWARTLRETVARKCDSPGVDKVTRIELTICHS